MFRMLRRRIRSSVAPYDAMIEESCPKFDIALNAAAIELVGVETKRERRVDITDEAL